MMVCMSHGAISRASGGSAPSAGSSTDGGMDGEAGHVGRRAAQHDRRRERRAVDVGEPAQEIGVSHDQPRIGIRHDMRQQAAAIGEIDRHVDRAEIVEAEPDADRIRPVGQPRQHLVALRDAECRESDRCAARDRLRLSVGPFGAVGETREHLVGRCGGVTIEQRPQHAKIGGGNARIKPGFRHRELSPFMLVASLCRHTKRTSVRRTQNNTRNSSAHR